MTQILLLNGSPVYPSRSAVLLAHYENIAKQNQWAVTNLAVRELDAKALLTAEASHPSLQAAFKAVEEALAMVVVTPTYKAAYSGVLKSFLDLLPQHALLGKKVLPLMLGATPLHALALDYSFKPLFMALGASHIASGAFLLDDRFSKQDGVYSLNPELQTFATSLLTDFMRA